ncbi:hypothetical protein [Streptomyces dubilierae]|uniref:Uncharacterized protein n=1 Tax=Streptomyces dubilierae TaxID=3075533 RepID=A0ABU2P6Q9_9ACTN|nr:hypothetical protein [Streptomyces sp. DSM 41921]MDT0387837.1 hypothetical protein [Streptomyces sp. DSM 41921]
MTRLTSTAGRLADGSSALARRLSARLADWVARARRDDLTGWRAALGCWLRLALLIFGLYLLWRLVRAVPVLLWLLSAGWIAAAWRAGRAPSPEASDETPSEAPEEAAPTPDVEAVRRLLLDVMGDAPAVHLRTVLAHLQKQGQWEGRKVTDLRVHLQRLDIPVSRSVKVAGTPTLGVRRRDLEAPSPAEPQEASPAPSTAA